MEEKFEIKNIGDGDSKKITNCISPKRCKETREKLENGSV